MQNLKLKNRPSGQAMLDSFRVMVGNDYTPENKVYHPEPPYTYTKIRPVAEYEEMGGIVISYPGTVAPDSKHKQLPPTGPRNFGIPDELIVRMQQADTANPVHVFIFCDDETELPKITARLQKCAEEKGIEFEPKLLHLIPWDTDTYWTRDYAPWWIVDKKTGHYSISKHLYTSLGGGSVGLIEGAEEVTARQGSGIFRCNDDYVITNACESAPYRIATNVQKNTCFWLKSQPNSLEYMLDKCEYVDEFLGGTVYQAFLSAARYHRWHSPVSGTIKMVKNVPGTYYAEVNSYPYDEAGPNESQGYITHVAARAIIIIEADNKDIGLVGVMPVGMSEVSSCVVSVQEGQHVNKGDEIGYFQFGGSTHCLIFQKDVIEQFVVGAIPAEDFNDSTLQKVRSKLATVRKNTKKTDSICVQV